jgi:hypothetical protein
VTGLAEVTGVRVDVVDYVEHARAAGAGAEAVAYIAARLPTARSAGGRRRLACSPPASKRCAGWSPPRCRHPDPGPGGVAGTLDARRRGPGIGLRPCRFWGRPVVVVLSSRSRRAVLLSGSLRPGSCRRFCPRGSRRPGSVLVGSVVVGSAVAVGRSGPGAVGGSGGRVGAVRAAVCR